jgi:glycosyltransferase involved in cell wall biosynthesis
MSRSGSFIPNQTQPNRAVSEPPESAAERANVPKVSIGLPVYNGEKYVGAAIEAILGQSFSDFELIICDNASSDLTEEICREAAARDPRIRYYRNPKNLGAAPNFNRCIDFADGLYFKWAAHDDICLPDYLARCVQVLDQSPDVIACHSGTQFIDGSGEVLSSYDLEDDTFSDPDPIARFASAIDERHFCIAVFALIRREALLKTSRIASYIGSDRNLIAQIALQGPIRHVPEVLFLSRDHGERSIRALDLRERGEWFDTTRPASGQNYFLRMFRENLRTLFVFPLSAGQRFRGMARLIGWLRMNRRQLVAEILGRR